MYPCLDGPLAASVPVPTEAFLNCVRVGDVMGVSDFISKYANDVLFRAKDGAGSSALIIAAQTGDTRIVRLLLGHRADSKVVQMSNAARPFEAFTTLRLALRGGHKDVVAQLAAVLFSECCCVRFGNFNFLL